MWLFTETGFLSVVRHPLERGVLIVRARDETSLMGLSAAAQTQIMATPERDYPFRVLTSREVFRQWVLEQVSCLEYANYKAQMWDARPEFGGALHDVWAAMRQVTPSGITKQDRDHMAGHYPRQMGWTDEDEGDIHSGPGGFEGMGYRCENAANYSNDEDDLEH